MNRKIEFSQIKNFAREKLSGNLAMFAFCMLFSTFVMVALLPRNYIYSFIDTVNLKISDYFRIFIASAVSESLMFTLTSAMYCIIFKRKQNEKTGIGLLLKKANLVFPSSVVAILLTKISFLFISFITAPVVSDYFYDKLFLIAVSYEIYNLIIAAFRFAAWLLSIYVSLAYILTPCIVADNPEINGIKSMKLSRRLMKKRKLNMLLFLISFAVWYIAGMCCFGLGMLWAHSYAMTAVYAYYLKCKETEIEKEIENKNEKIYYNERIEKE